MPRIKIFVIFNIIIIVFCYLFINLLGTRINDKFKDYSLTEATKLAKYVVNHAVNNRLVGNIDMNALLVADKNSNDEIKTVDFNVKAINTMLSDVTANILGMFKDLENGNSNILDLSRNILTNTNIKNYRGGIIFEVPVGVASDNFILSNLGPKIPVKISLIGELEAHISTSLVQYGINNAMVTVYANISVSMQVLMPFMSDRITIDNKIPISMSLINGKIPQYYISGMNANSPIVNVPIN